jgi:serine protease AprX
VIVGCASPSPQSGQPVFKSPAPAGARVSVDPAVLTDDLRDTLDAAAAGDFVSVIVKLASRAELADAASFQGAGSKEEQRTAAISLLQAHARDSQDNLLHAASSLEADGLARDIRPLWVANAICLEVIPEAITYLAEYQEIDYIAVDTDLPVFMAETTWSVEHVNSPEVWQRAAGAIRGAGVVVAVIDSGVDLSHPDLQDRIWINRAEDIDGDGRITANDANGIDDDRNGWTDDIAGWDFGADDNNPSPNLIEAGRAGGHGTHVAGIISGDGTRGLATGIAPGAKLMVLKVNSQVSAWRAMEYALVNGADVINLSLGWPTSMSPDAATWRDAVDNATDAGVLVVAASGNGGRAPMVHAIAPADISLPGSVPRALTVSPVAAPSATDWLDPIATFSASGPVSWQSVRGFNDYPYPPGLMKPDLTAPGIDVSSTVPGGGYELKSGSSMAAAHVSGAAALLLEADPTLQPHETTFLLRETAWRFTDPNDVRGWGRLDAFNAVNHQRDRNPYDLVIGTGGVHQPAESIWIDNNGDGEHDGLVPGATNRIFARVRNRGGQVVGNTELRFYYAPAGTVAASALSHDSARETYRYIGSYRVPVIGPAGSSQDSFTGAVEWMAPRSDGRIGHWAIAVEAVTQRPFNAAEAELSNNRAVRNGFEISLAPGQTSAFGFNIYEDPARPGEPLDVEIVRSGGTGDFEIGLSLPGQDSLVQTGLEVPEAGSPGIEKGNARGDARAMLLLRDRALIESVRLPGDGPVAARLLIRAPEIDNDMFPDQPAIPTRITINASNERGTVGSFAVDVRIDPDAARLNRIIYAQK